MTISFTFFRKEHSENIMLRTRVAHQHLCGRTDVVEFSTTSTIFRVMSNVLMSIAILSRWKMTKNKKKLKVERICLPSDRTGLLSGATCKPFAEHTKSGPFFCARKWGQWTERTRGNRSQQRHCEFQRWGRGRSISVREEDVVVVRTSCFLNSLPNT